MLRLLSLKATALTSSGVMGSFKNLIKVKDLASRKQTNIFLHPNPNVTDPTCGLLIESSATGCFLRALSLRSQDNSVWPMWGWSRMTSDSAVPTYAKIACARKA